MHYTILVWSPSCLASAGARSVLLHTLYLCFYFMSLASAGERSVRYEVLSIAQCAYIYTCMYMHTFMHTYTYMYMVMPSPRRVRSVLLYTLYLYFYFILLPGGCDRFEGERMPMLFLVPRMSEPFSNDDYAMLGLGDVVRPRSLGHIFYALYYSLARARRRGWAAA